MSKQVMLDLETMGNRPTSAIVAIGACAFDVETQLISGRFYRTVDLESSMAAGLTVDAGTIIWWLKQGDPAREAITSNSAKTLETALVDFKMWLKELGAPDAGIWGNGADFDNAILANAYRAIGHPAPWPFWANRCYRTVKNLAPHIKIEREGVYHNALDDAVSQAKHLMKILRAEAPK